MPIFAQKFNHFVHFLKIITILYLIFCEVVIPRNELNYTNYIFYWSIFAHFCSLFCVFKHFINLLIQKCFAFFCVKFKLPKTNSNYVSIFSGSDIFANNYLVLLTFYSVCCQYFCTYCFK